MCVAPEEACELQQMLINVRGHRSSPTTHVVYQCCGGQAQTSPQVLRLLHTGRTVQAALNGPQSHQSVSPFLFQEAQKPSDHSHRRYEARDVTQRPPQHRVFSMRASISGRRRFCLQLRVQNRV